MHVDPDEMLLLSLSLSSRLPPMMPVVTFSFANPSLWRESLLVARLAAGVASCLLLTLCGFVGCT